MPKNTNKNVDIYYQPNRTSILEPINEYDNHGTILLSYLKKQNINSIEKASKYTVIFGNQGLEVKLTGNDALIQIAPNGKNSYTGNEALKLYCSIHNINNNYVNPKNVKEYKEALKTSFQNLISDKDLPNFEDIKNQNQKLISILKDYHIDLIDYLTENKDPLKDDFISFCKENNFLSDNDLLLSNEVKVEDQDGSKQMIIEESLDSPLTESSVSMVEKIELSGDDYISE